MNRHASPLVLAAALAVLALPRPGIGADPAAPERGTPNLLAGGEQKSLQSLKALVAVDATLSGAAAACRLPVATVILHCTGLTIRNWSTSTGLEPLRDVDAALKFGKAVWDDYFARAREAQTAIEPPLSCGEVGRRAMAAPVLRVCGLVGEPAGNAPLPFQPPAGIRVQ